VAVERDFPEGFSVQCGGNRACVTSSKQAPAIQSRSTPRNEESCQRSGASHRIESGVIDMRGASGKNQRRRGGLYVQITTIGLDIAKNVFQVHGIDAEGRRSEATSAQPNTGVHGDRSLM
jgi:hypothetical protein